MPCLSLGLAAALAAVPTVEIVSVGVDARGDTTLPVTLELTSKDDFDGVLHLALETSPDESFDERVSIRGQTGFLVDLEPGRHRVDTEIPGLDWSAGSAQARIRWSLDLDGSAVDQGAFGLGELTRAASPPPVSILGAPSFFVPGVQGDTLVIEKLPDRLSDLVSMGRLVLSTEVWSSLASAERRDLLDAVFLGATLVLVGAEPQEGEAGERLRDVGHTIWHGRRQHLVEAPVGWGKLRWLSLEPSELPTASAALLVLATAGETLQPRRRVGMSVLDLIPDAEDREAHPRILASRLVGDTIPGLVGILVLGTAGLLLGRWGHPGALALTLLFPLLGVAAAVAWFGTHSRAEHHHDRSVTWIEAGGRRAATSVVLRRGGGGGRQQPWVEAKPGPRTCIWWRTPQSQQRLLHDTTEDVLRLTPFPSGAAPFRQVALRREQVQQASPLATGTPRWTDDGLSGRLVIRQDLDRSVLVGAGLATGLGALAAGEVLDLAEISSRPSGLAAEDRKLLGSALVIPGPGKYPIIHLPSYDSIFDTLFLVARDPAPPAAPRVQASGGVSERPTRLQLIRVEAPHPAPDWPSVLPAVLRIQNGRRQLLVAAEQLEQAVAGERLTFAGRPLWTFGAAPTPAAEDGFVVFDDGVPGPRDGTRLLRVGHHVAEASP